MSTSSHNSAQTPDDAKSRIIVDKARKRMVIGGVLLGACFVLPFVPEGIRAVIGLTAMVMLFSGLFSFSKHAPNKEVADFLNMLHLKYGFTMNANTSKKVKSTFSTLRSAPESDPYIVVTGLKGETEKVKVGLFWRNKEPVAVNELGQEFERIDPSALPNANIYVSYPQQDMEQVVGLAYSVVEEKYGIKIWTPKKKKHDEPGVQETSTRELMSETLSCMVQDARLRPRFAVRFRTGAVHRGGVFGSQYTLVGEVYWSDIHNDFILVDIEGVEFPHADESNDMIM